MKPYFYFFLTGIIFPQTVIAEFSAMIEQEFSIDSDAHAQKSELIFQPQWNVALTDNLDMTFIARARWDPTALLGPMKERPENFSQINGAVTGGSEGQVVIREWYFDSEFLNSFWRLGKQQVVWGQADGLKILDVINPQSFREFILDDFEDSRIPLWMINIEIPFYDNSLQILWVTDPTYNEFAEANTEYEITSPLFIPQLPQNSVINSFEKNKPNLVLSDSDFGMRYSMFYQGWDLSFNYFYHYHDSPVIYQQVTPQGIDLNSTFERNHLIGASASNAFGDFTLRSEIGYNTQTFHLSQNLSQNGIHESAEFSLVIGLDWQGLDDTLISMQWFQSYLLDYENTVIRPQNNNIVSFLYKRSFQNETWDLEVLALHGLDQTDGSIQTQLSYLWQSNLKIWLGSDIFYGSKSGFFGQFKNQDRITFGFEWGI